MDLRELDEPPRSADLVIIGAGVVGAATAFHAARAGLDCILLERRSLPATLTTPRAMRSISACQRRRVRGVKPLLISLRCKPWMGGSSWIRVGGG